jgi:hypothetical protein
MQKSVHGPGWRKVFGVGASLEIDGWMPAIRSYKHTRSHDEQDRSKPNLKLMNASKEREREIAHHTCCEQGISGSQTSSFGQTRPAKMAEQHCS